MTSPATTGPQQPQLNSRTVRDIAEHDPAQINEAWCRKIFRQLLQSLELQYAMRMPHRAITPDTVVFHDNGEPLLLPSIISDPEPEVADDLTALGALVHFAITRELAPTGPLRGRGLEGYSHSLLSAVDFCMSPDPDLRPRGIDELRDLLGIVALGAPMAAPDAALPEPALPEPDLSGFLEAAADAPPPAPLPQASVALPQAPAPAQSASPLKSSETVQPAEAARSPEAVRASEPVQSLESPQSGEAVHASTLLDSPAPAHLPPPSHPPATQPLQPPQPQPAQPSHAAQPASPPPQSSSPPAAPAPPAPARDADTPPRRRVPVPNRWRRWAVAGAAAAVLLAIALAGFAELRGPASFDRIALGLPQTGDAGPASAAASETDPGAQSGAALPAQAGGVMAAAAGAQAVDGAADSAAGTAPAGASPGSVAPGATADSANPVDPDGSATAVVDGGAVYKLQIQPWGVVYVDGVDRGVSPPVKRLLLAPGRHTIRVANPNFQDRVLEIDTAGGDGRIAIDFRNDAP